MLISIFFIALMLIMAVVAIGMSLLRGIISLLFGSRTTQQPHSHGQSHHAQSHSQSRTQSQQTTTSGGRKRDKIFDKTEGEYVDFEEIKE